MFSLLILFAASFIVASGSMVIKGDVITSLALIVFGAMFLAKTLMTKSLSVMIPMGFPSWLVIITQPNPCFSISSATLLMGSSSFIVMTGLLIASFTSILADLNPMSDNVLAS